MATEPGSTGIPTLRFAVSSYSATSFLRTVGCPTSLLTVLLRNAAFVNVKTSAGIGAKRNTSRNHSDRELAMNGSASGKYSGK